MAISLYIHIPFCQSKCPYCSFPVCVGNEHRSDEYLAALAIEAKPYQGSTVETIYVGGGTPSVLEEPQLIQLVELIRKNFRYKTDAEFTIEVNPASFNFSKAKLMSSLGFNRISLGAQSFHQKYLDYLGRTHTPQDIEESFTDLRKAGFSNINLDLMFSLPGETDQEIAEEIERLSELNSEHLSLYSLNIENKSLFYVKKVQLEDDDLRARQYLKVIGGLQKKGFQQ